MTDARPERRIRTGARVALAVAAVASLVLGAAVRSGLATLLGVLGAGLFALGTRHLAHDDNRRRATGSLAVAAGALAGAGAVALPVVRGGNAPLVAALTVALAAVAHDAVVEDPAENVRSVVRVLTASTPAIVAGFAASYALHSGALLSGTFGAVVAGAGAVRYSTFGALVALQAFAIAAAVLVEAAVPALERWSADDRDSLAALREFGTHPTDVPFQVWVAFSVQVLALAVDPGATWFETALDALSVLGTAVGTLLRSGLLHLPLVVACLLASVTIAARAVQIGFLSWAGRNPPRTLAYATGGVVAGVVAVAASGVTAITWFGTPPAPETALAQAGPGVVALGILFAALVGAVVVVVPLSALSATRFVAAGQGYAVGAALLVLASLGTAGAGGTPVAVFLGTAAALLVWDLGRNATTLRRRLGRRVDTRSVEATHATASLLVAVLAVGAATVAVYVVGPPTLAGVDPTRAKVATALATVAVVAFALLLER